MVQILRYYLSGFFSILLYFLRTIQFLHIIFQRCSWYYSEGASLMKPFYSISSFSKIHSEGSWGSFWDVLLYFSESLPTKNISKKLHKTMCNKILYRHFLFYSHSRSTKKSLHLETSTYPSAESNM